MSYLTTRLFKIQDERLMPLQPAHVPKEKAVESWLADDATLLGEKLVLIGRQVQTAFGKVIDLMSLDAAGNVCVIEVKRDRTPREVVAQLLDYGSWVQGLDAAALSAIAGRNRGVDLGTEYRRTFGYDVPADVNRNHRLIVVASALDESTRRIVTYLSQRGVDINGIFFSPFSDGDARFVAFTWIVDPLVADERAAADERTAMSPNEGAASRVAPWSGFWAINVGEKLPSNLRDYDVQRSWEDDLTYGFISAGQGEQWSAKMAQLSVGDRVFAYLNGAGYVGYGIVDQPATPIAEFVPTGHDEKLLALPLVQPDVAANSSDPAMCEYAIGVRWIVALERNGAKPAAPYRGTLNRILDAKRLAELKALFNVSAEAV